MAPAGPRISASESPHRVRPAPVRRRLGLRHDCLRGEDFARSLIRQRSRIGRDRPCWRESRAWLTFADACRRADITAETSVLSNEITGWPAVTVSPRPTRTRSIRPGTGTGTWDTRPGSSSTFPGATTSSWGTGAVPTAATRMRLSWGWPAGNFTRFPLLVAAERLGCESAWVATGLRQPRVPGRHWEGIEIFTAGRLLPLVP
jgi:hypothetical protein